MNKWEYKSFYIKVTKRWIKTDIDDFEEDFNKLGNEGWELIQAKNILVSGYTDKILIIFRRPKP